MRVPRGLALLALGYGAVAGVMYACGAFYLDVHDGTSPGLGLWHALGRGLMMAAMWTAIGASVLYIARRAAPVRPRDLWAAGVGALLAINVIATVQDALTCVLLPWMVCSLGPHWVAGRAGALPTVLMISGSLLVLELGRLAAERAHRDRLRTHRLAEELARARLAALDVQLRPHFLFNTLQSIATLAHHDVPASRTMLSRLSQLLRESATREAVQVVPLRDELRLLSLYTGIEAVRFGPRLNVHVDVDPAVEEVPVPHLLLQPLVENAIRHAVARVGRGRVEVRARLDAARRRLCLSVADDGPGLPDGWSPPTDRLGLANVEGRLDALYGSAARMELVSGATGLTVRIDLPLDAFIPPP
jgi:signal transduction histidine kinase